MSNNKNARFNIIFKCIVTCNFRKEKTLCMTLFKRKY